MGAGTLTIFSASAGSGKTYNLARVYLEMLFASKYSYRRILAVTFTHKATAEMKSRILDELNNLGTGRDSKYLAGLALSTGKSENEIRKEAKEILLLILHDYSRFSISTIDSFFQKILRAFTRDIGLHYGFNIELDHTAILANAVDKMMASAASEPSLRRWLSEYVRANIEDDKTWNIRKSIADLSEELFKEKFRLVPTEEKMKIQNKDFLGGYIKEMRAIVYAFQSEMTRIGNEGLDIIRQFDLPDDIFFYKSRGVPGFLRSLAEGVIKAPNVYVRAAVENPPRWCTGQIPEALGKAINSGLDESVRKALHYYDNYIVGYNTAKSILSNIYTLGILSDVLGHVHSITQDDNIFLLSDAGELIYLITEKDQAPFIYEKVGNVFENFMIDEFQDTSVIQWQNLWMLISNSMAQGFDNLVVGDIKQSIYRWRNSNWQILHNLKEAVDNKRYISKPLETNYRSSSNIITFNNSLFSIIPHLLDREFSDMEIVSGFGKLYSEVSQKDPGTIEGGYIKMAFIEDLDDKNWKDIVLEKLPGTIESILNQGYNPSDIGILVRDNREGATVMKSIIEYSYSLPEDKKAGFNIVSNDSLLLVNSPVINFLISVLSVLDNRTNMVARAAMLRFFLLATGHNDAEMVPLESENLAELSSDYFPEGYETFLDSIRYLTLWDITEKSIRFFSLGKYSFNIAYLNSFQDLVLKFSSGRNPGLPSFIDWWQTQGSGSSISLPEHQDAIKVLTIHKSKGLEFGVVILPFISWNLDHKSFQSNILWVKPGLPPFDKVGIVPVRYRNDLSETIFAEDYYKEKYSAYVDNINLLYVAFTRAKYGMFGFAPVKPDSSNCIAKVLRNAIAENDNDNANDENESLLRRFYDRDKGTFDFGSLPSKRHVTEKGEFINVTEYPVSSNIESLKLRLNWENYLDIETNEIKARINYGKLMHEIFEEIVTLNDVETSVRKKVLEGKIPATDEKEFNDRILSKLNLPGVRDWFDTGIEIFNEATILIPRSGTRRPDRIIFRDGKTIIVDFKFGKENSHYLFQLRQYKFLLSEMGYGNIEAFIWYVDSDKIVTV